MNKGKISIALTKSLIEKVSEKCRRINQSSNYIETLVLEDLQKDELKPVTARTSKREEIAIRLG